MGLAKAQTQLLVRLSCTAAAAAAAAEILLLLLKSSSAAADVSANPPKRPPHLTRSFVADRCCCSPLSWCWSRWRTILDFASRWDSALLRVQSPKPVEMRSRKSPEKLLLPQPTDLDLATFLPSEDDAWLPLGLSASSPLFPPCLAAAVAELVCCCCCCLLVMSLPPPSTEEEVDLLLAIRHDGVCSTAATTALHQASSHSRFHRLAPLQNNAGVVTRGGRISRNPPPAHPFFIFFLFLWLVARKENLVLRPAPAGPVREWPEPIPRASPTTTPASELKEVGEEEEEKGGGWREKKGLDLEEDTSLPSFSCRQKAHTPPVLPRSNCKTLLTGSGALQPWMEGFPQLNYYYYDMGTRAEARAAEAT
ncbi:hypothetical protein MUK42_32635 [Musa troglodytarum]|uniref:Uncharacterized protein n=1 Tax=Musa troglodytarum TaxID=320322 RepID=A0A9E7FAB9_9LILI|nr:hypothetical protein MUK42_32635 [Musa troglodytarum]